MPDRKNWKAKKRDAHLCPRCMRSMRYIQLPSPTQKWAPFEWGWICEKCSDVFMLDGSINPKERTAEKRYQIRQRARMFHAIKAVAFDIRGTNGQIKSAQEVSPERLVSNDGSLASNERDVIEKILPQQLAVSSGAICEEKRKEQADG